jgi:hypothetical protein
MARNTAKKHSDRLDRLNARRQAKMATPAIGLEAEFSILVDGEPAKPEDVFGSPTAFVRQPMMHRTGRSYHLPTGSAVYFDTGVIEIATPMVELQAECPARAGRMLWESIHFIRKELDAWENRKDREVSLAGFSAHYNVSFELTEEQRGTHRTVQKLAILLTHILPIPVMLLAANRQSTGIGVRPRRNRIEITADFTPDPRLSIATATLIVAIVREVMSWDSYELDRLDRVPFPVLKNFQPIPHSSRKGWVAKYTCFAENPFMCNIDAPLWDTRDGCRRSLREIGDLVTRAFWKSIRYYADPLSRALITDVMHGRARSLLELNDRPDCYTDIGRACSWDNLYSERTLSRSLYERVLLRAISRTPTTVDGEQYVPVGMRGWSHVVLRRESDGQREVMSLDELGAQISR